MELAYRTPMILNVELNLNELSSLEEIYEEMILERSAADLAPSAMPERVHYDKIPKVFTTLDAWPRRTNLRCWSCDFNFESRPVFVPMDIKESFGGVEIPVYGNMCSFPCAALYITANYTRDQQWKLFEYLFFLFKIFRGRYVTKIDVAPRKTLMQQYGGTMEPHEFRKKIDRLEEDILRRAISYEDPSGPEHSRDHSHAQSHVQSNLPSHALEALLTTPEEYSEDEEDDSLLEPLLDPMAEPLLEEGAPQSRSQRAERERVEARLRAALPLDEALPQTLTQALL